MNNTFDELKKFILDERAEFSFELRRETQIERDLNIWGDDACDFIMAFGDRFRVDISKFNIDDYFDPEGDAFLRTIQNWFKWKHKKNKKSLTLGDLEQAIVCKKLH